MNEYLCDRLEDAWKLTLNYQEMAVFIRLIFLAYDGFSGVKTCQTLKQLSDAVKFKPETISAITTRLANKGLITKHTKTKYAKNEGIIYEINLDRVEELLKNPPCL